MENQNRDELQKRVTLNATKIQNEDRNIVHRLGDMRLSRVVSL